MDKATIVRVVLFVLAYVNAFLAAHNYHTIKLDDKTIGVIVAFAISAYGFYKHNFFGKHGAELKKAIKDESAKVIENLVKKDK
jgi:SPP1 family holin